MKIPIITGYTATGKTELSLRLAEKLDIEIISADAFQVYKFMDIGTGKPSKDELLKVKHHLIDFLYPDEIYSAGIFFEKAESTIEEIIKKNKIPLIVGGTGLYVEVLTKGLFKSPEINIEFRNQLLKDIERKGTEYFYNILMEKDPEYAPRITKGDRNKIVRAFEIMESTGTTVTEAHKIYHRHPKYSYEIFIIDKTRERLYDDINKRVVKMFEMGWIDEVKSLLDKGYSPVNHSFKAIGYSEIVSFLNGKIASKDKLIQQIQTKTRQFAKRQITWFKHMEGINKLSEDITDCYNELYKYIKLFW